MQVKCTETTGIKHHPYYLSHGDVTTVPDKIGQYFIDNGWAENVATGERGKRQGGDVSLDIQNSTLGVTSTEV